MTEQEPRDEFDILSIEQKIDWALDTIRHKESFGMDELNASLSRERRAKGVLLDCKKTIEKQKKEIEELSNSVRLKKLNIETGKMEIDFEVSKSIMENFSGAMYELVKNAPNYVECDLVHQESGERLTLNIQKKNKKTPHQFRIELEEAIKAKDAEIESIRKELEATSIRRGYELIKQKNKSITEAILILDEIVDARNISCGNYEKAKAWLESNK